MSQNIVSKMPAGKDTAPKGAPHGQAAASLRRKVFDRYEDCGCVDRWETEGGPAVGEDDEDASAL